MSSALVDFVVLTMRPGQTQCSGNLQLDGGSLETVNEVRGLKDRRIQHEKEELRSYLQKEHELWIAGAKALMVLHGAGVAAMLGFMQALVGKPPLSAFKVYGCSALVIYLVGALCGLLVLRRRTAYSLWMARDHAIKLRELDVVQEVPVFLSIDEPNGRRSYAAALHTTKAGVFLFCLASLVAVVGVARTVH